MVKYLYSLDNSQPMSTLITTNADVVDGDLLAITAGLVGPAAAADSGIIGIAIGNALSGASCKVLLLTPWSVIRASTFGSVPTKTTLTAADRFGTAFDWDATAKKVNLDDTTDGIFKIVNYDNANTTADCVIDASALWNA